LSSETTDRVRNPNYPMFWLAESQTQTGGEYLREKPLTATLQLC